MNANLNGALGMRYVGGAVGGVGQASSGSNIAPNTLGPEASPLPSTSTTALMSPPSRQLYPNSSLSKSSPTSAVKRKRSSGSFATKSDDSDSSSSSSVTAMGTASGVAVNSGNDLALPSSSPQQLGSSKLLETQNLILQQQQLRQQQQQLQQHLQQGNTQVALTHQRIGGENVVGANSLSISLPLTAQSQVLTTGGMMSTAPAFRQLTEMQQQQQQQQQRQTVSSGPSPGVAIEQVIMSSPGQFQGGQVQAQAR